MNISNGNIYIVTYATHEEGYFSLLKKSCPDLIVLGMNTKWNGFYGRVKEIVNFCKTVNENDIICHVDGFDSVVLCNKEKIKEKFLESKSNILFSSLRNPSNIIIKYLQDKLFSSCKGEKLNAGLYIGYAKNIIDFFIVFKLFSVYNEISRLKFFAK